MVIQYYEESCRRTIDIDALIDAHTEVKAKGKVKLWQKTILRKIFKNIVRYYPGNLSQVGDHIFQLNEEAGKMFYGCL